MLRSFWLFGMVGGRQDRLGAFVQERKRDKMAKKAQQTTVLHNGLRYTPSGKGVIGAIGKPPGFRVVRHQAVSSKGSEQSRSVSDRGATSF